MNKYEHTIQGELPCHIYTFMITINPSLLKKECSQTEKSGKITWQMSLHLDTDILGFQRMEPFDVDC